MADRGGPCAGDGTNGRVEECSLPPKDGRGVYAASGCPASAAGASDSLMR